MDTSPTVDEAVALSERWLHEFVLALDSGNASRLESSFVDDAYWRDLLALTWKLQTIRGAGSIAGHLVRVAKTARATAFRLSGTPAVIERSRWGTSIESFVSFETDVARAEGHLRLLRDDAGGWRAWTFLTSMDELKGFEEQAGRRRPLGFGFDEPHDTAGENWLDKRRRTQDYRDRSPDVLVIGAAQAGLSVAARLRQLQVDTLLIERTARVGDSWRQRYHSLVLHNEVWANHLPYLPFPANYPVYLAKDQLADWLEAYASVMELNVWCSTELIGADYSDTARQWTVTLRRTTRAGDETVVLHPRHVVLATGVFGPPRMPHIAGIEDFSGVFAHAADFEGLDVPSGSSALVVGTGNSAHDIATDLCQGGVEVTMLQRSTTCVVSLRGAARVNSIFEQEGQPLARKDLVVNSVPLPLLAEFHKELSRRIEEGDRELLAGLTRAGFAHDYGEDGSGFLLKYLRHGGGYYINVGGSDLIIEGRIKVKRACEIERVRGDVVTFTDGTSMRTDAIVAATGYENMVRTVEAIFGLDVAARVGPVWGLDDQGELRAMWRRTGQAGLWIMGGSLQQCRPYSKYLAMQIKAALVGLTATER